MGIIRFGFVLALLAGHASAETAADDPRQICVKQANAFEAMVDVYQSGVPRDKAEQAMRQRYPGSTIADWRQEVPQHLFTFAYQDRGLNVPASRGFFYNLCLTEMAGIDSPQSTAALLAAAKKCQQQPGTSPAAIAKCIDQATLPIVSAALRAKKAAQ